MQMNRAKRRSKLNLIMLLRYNINSSLFLLNIKIKLVVFFNLYVMLLCVKNPCSLNCNKIFTLELSEHITLLIHSLRTGSTILVSMF